MKKTLFLLCLLYASISFAAIPVDYYEAAYNKKGTQLHTALHNIIDNHTVVSYAGLYSVYETSDNTTDNKVWDMYSYCTWTHNNNKCGNYSKVCDCYNREHSVPQSWFDSDSPMVSDAFHVYPTDGKVNGQRSNFPFGECTGGTTLSNGKGRVGSSTFSGYSGTVFEPVDEYKGDFARTYFYMATRYSDKVGSWGGGVFSSSNFGLTSSAVSLYLKWHRQDPVSTKEITRNDAVYAHQDNRNPFIDHPELAEYIWGNKNTLSWNESSLTEEHIFNYFVYPNPASDKVFVHVDTTKNVQYILYSVDKLVIETGVFDNEWSIDVRALSSGVYVLQLFVDGVSSSYKILVTNK